MTVELKLPTHVDEMKAAANRIETPEDLQQYLFDYVPMASRYPPHQTRYKTLFVPTDRLDASKRSQFAQAFLQLVFLDLQDELARGDRHTVIQLNDSFDELDRVIADLRQRFENFTIAVQRY